MFRHRGHDRGWPSGRTGAAFMNIGPTQDVPDFSRKFIR